MQSLALTAERRQRVREGIQGFRQQILATPVFVSHAQRPYNGFLQVPSYDRASSRAAGENDRGGRPVYARKQRIGGHGWTSLAGGNARCHQRSHGSVCMGCLTASGSSLVASSYVQRRSSFHFRILCGPKSPLLE